MMSSEHQLRALKDKDLVNWWAQLVKANTNKSARQELVDFIVSANPGMPNNEAEQAILKGRKMVIKEFQRRNIPLPS